ncbi:MAG: DNA topoisomerase I [Candidatus Diapherotrites archaeon]|nr:DNA topoisomerase I [Candidatus Diapherotrites archaeon]
MELLFMIVVIAEKAIAARRIANILSNGKAEEKRKNNALYFDFLKDGKLWRVIPLSGHIVELDFPQHMKDWRQTELMKLVDAKTEKRIKMQNIVSLLKENAKEAERIIVATDADREGEAIGLEAVEIMKEENPNIEVKRALFSAITEQDIRDAFKNLKELDYNLAMAAEARQQIDLVWGATLTRFLSLVANSTGKNFLSAGRVQSPTLALIVDREKEIKEFKPKPYWEIQAELRKESKFIALHKKGRFFDEKEAKEIFEKLKNESKATVTKVEVKKSRLKRPTPMNTTEFLRAASRLGFTAGKAMSIAEELYQQGFISYPRTDNQSYPDTLNLRAIINKLLSVKELSKDAETIIALGKLNPSQGKKTKDHPPIHPVAAASKERLSREQWKIYELICRHFLATLAEDAIVRNTTAYLQIKGEEFVAKGKQYEKLGWRAIYPYLSSEERILPELAKGDTVDVIKIEMLRKETKPKPRYSQAALIKLMEALGLGTKATRHSILQKLFSRKYISGIKAIKPNNIAFSVTDTLERFDSKIVKPEMTAKLEEEMSLIAAGKKKKEEVVNESKEMLRKVLKELIANHEKIGKALKEALRQDLILGKCKCGGKLIIRFSAKGKRFVGCTNYPSCTITFPLPQKGTIQKTEELCSYCKMPIIKLIQRRKALKFCINPECESKKQKKEKEENTS